MPAGFRRSRALWDETKRIDHTTSSRLYATVCAILYELQPIRFSHVNWLRMVKTTFKIVRQILRGIISYLPGVLLALAKFLWQRKLGCLGVVAYYFAVRWIHEFLEAGPMVLMFTALIGIFTIGLSDNDENREGLSAYSVFNRGFERLLGSVDAEALLAQHVGMGPGAALPVGVADDNAPPPMARRRQQHRAAAPRIEPQRNNNNNNNNNNDDDDNGEQDDQADAQPRNNQARRSGKKARRRNLEQRRDRQRQREAAMALGMQGAETEQEMVEIQRLIENQIAAEQANNEN
ncbi:unnamed protein product [Cylindrotheca closterium]|uniref:SAYSvFN domain-containing protein n=1 Tax=Cylindrotheca closterium TaxID=2856 RepID=A0AAD2FRG4_9STRA|nr:unnamed protein product [Cylindrotheca closterium]